MNKTLVIIFILFLFTHRDSQGKEWIELNPMPTARHGICSVEYKNEIWIIGGKDKFFNTLDIVERYFPIGDYWQNDLPSLQVKRFNAAAVVYDNKIYVIGGSDENELPLRSTEYIDPETDNQWQFGPELNLERVGLTAVVYDSAIYAIGGFGVIDSELDDVEIFNAKNSGWEFSNSWLLFKKRVLMSSVIVKDSVYTIGGLFNGPVNYVEYYHPNSGTVLRNPMTYHRYNFAAAAVNDTIFVIGGASLDEFSLAKKVEKYDPNKNEWFSDFYAGNTLDIALQGLTAVSYHGCIYIFGGKNFREIPVNTTQKLEISFSATKVHPKNKIISEKFQLLQNYPNPFNPETTITFTLAQNINNNIELNILNINGQVIKSYIWNSLTAGEYKIVWNGKNMSGKNSVSGIYFYQLIYDGKEKITRKMMLIR